ncbi:DNRLRE domain-containing protein [Iamia sp. SCSIO 61187]|uniref:CBM96 family carbohydrate-binding protein n=1 Tax=Iamia sp. SCSIO 61187 TaxID=2722752 RepID=UPI001C634242|nr:DNRLRE domain-containing protein [Iamia sp. SCSIO 61187]QYG92237.1 DNRLRE domain-containing protein [Iamia sp. SCSIO 61187]
MSTRSAPRWTRQRVVAILAVVVGLAGLGVTATPGAPSAADPGDVGWEGPSYEGASGSPSGSKPQSKVWFNDGLWWATLYDSASGDFHIWRLDVTRQTWVDTGTLVDTRPNSRSDALWTGQHLYIANHVFSESGGTAPAQLRRYSYDSATKRYSADPGFPVTINGVRSETLVIDREPTGRLWATWVEGGQVMVAHTTTADTAWSAPFALPVAGSNASSDDISAVVAHRSDRIGILWSNQDDETMSFAYHLNSSAPGTWSAREIAYSGAGAADDHIDFAAVQDVGGRVLAAVKTSRSGSSVLTHLLDRDPATGTWSSHTYGLGSDNHTRPIAVVDSEHQRVHMFATRGQAGGSIYEKSAPLSAIDFPSGPGTPVLTDASSADINNPTSTKQTVSSATGLVVLATNDSTRRYWTHYDPLGGPGPGPVTPSASFTRSPATGTAPLDVAFTDTSTGSPTSWAWTFGDGATSTAQHPTHRYSAPGTYTVSLTATNAAGSDTITQTGSVTVTTAPPTGTPLTFTATADGLVKSSSPTRSYGGDAKLQVRAPDPAYESYVRFDLSGLGGAPTSARLRLFVTDASPVSGTATGVQTGWTEGGLTWNTRPGAIGGPLGSAGASTAGQWVEYDVTAGVAGDGPVAFAIRTTSTNSLITSSREGAHPPQLVVTAGGTSPPPPPPPPPPTPPSASFTRSPATGTAPLDVAFTDTSTGSPTSWAWTFGDGATSTAQHPTHRYSAPGTYTVSLTATNAAGSDTITQTGWVTVTTAPPTGTPLTFTATADGLVQSGSPSKSYGTTADLKVRAPTPAYESYVRFDLSGLGGAPTSARLRLWVTDASPTGGVVTPVGAGWTEASLTWNTRPAALSSAVATLGATTAGSWVEVDVTAAVAGDGALALRLTTPSTNSAVYSSRETTRPPQLVVVP